MIYSEVLESIKLILLGGDVPLIVGESGIGKTSLIKSLCKKEKYYLVNIDANLLKEGEIGGLPMVTGGKTIYAPHYKLKDVQENLDKDNNGVLLFIDELNRCEHEVQQELMNLIINREINGLKIDESVKIIAAMNPSNNQGGTVGNYEVVEMDTAQENRFVWINMECDLKEWIKWGMNDGKISEEIIEFISTFPGYLNKVNTSDISATPRSWERVNRAYVNYGKNKGEYSGKVLFNVISGNVGVAIATDFINFVENRKNTIATPKQVLEYDYLPFELRDILAKESHSRLYILAKGCLQRIEKENKFDKIELLSQLLSIYPKDLRLGIMKEIKMDMNKDIYEMFLNNDTFMECFFNIYC